MSTKFLHTRIRVSDLEKSSAWYCDTCGFVVKHRSDKSPSGNQIVLLQLPGSQHLIELTYSPEFKVEFPEDLMHTCIGVDDIVTYCGELEKKGYEIWPEEWKHTFTNSGMKMAFITDPDGYEVEILEN